MKKALFSLSSFTLILPLTTLACNTSTSQVSVSEQQEIDKILDEATFSVKDKNLTNRQFTLANLQVNNLDTTKYEIKLGQIQFVNYGQIKTKIWIVSKVKPVLISKHINLILQEMKLAKEELDDIQSKLKIYLKNNSYTAEDFQNAGGDAFEDASSVATLKQYVKLSFSNNRVMNGKYQTTLTLTDLKFNQNKQDYVLDNVLPRENK
ncbi:hypothetical protein [Mycoplasmopsis columbinasalis]|uniref:Lipoprotein n=1 Tax=Mycoplasmopsis columbinasalis TaxID=114880 RepID=A0A449B9K2_9BACT|nr:hypothetical protein [Mycoplasmopsis columbinasalis]VEU77848.1 Uncharacterised protein [Mycoplasmopsis columbinasalis]